MRIQVTAPINTPASAPVVVRQQMSSSSISSIIIRIPYGHAYLTGIRILDNKGAPILPDRNSNTNWIVGDSADVERRSPVTMDGPIYGIQVQAYNTDDTFPHSWYIDLD